jgi:hypothetical protein
MLSISRPHSSQTIFILEMCASLLPGWLRGGASPGGEEPLPHNRSRQVTGKVKTL